MRDNVAHIKSAVKCSKIMGVLKADAYGHGLGALCHLGDFDMIGVATADEGVAARRKGASAPILVFCYDRRDTAKCLKYDMAMTVSSAREVAELSAAAEEAGAAAKAHVAVDSGMNRYGVKSIAEEGEVLRALRSCPNIYVTGIYTHFYDSDRAHNAVQYAKFGLLTSRLTAEYPDAYVHMAASGALTAPKYRCDMVRAGIIMYGYSGNGTLPVEPVMRVTSRIQNVRKVYAGEYVGYSCKFRAEYDIIVAVIYGGYADGVRRDMTGGEVIIRNRRCKIIGNVCMDVFFADVTGVDGAAVGDEVQLLGRGNDAAYWAGRCGTIPYEIITGFNGRTETIYE